MESGVISDVSLLFLCSRMLGLTPYTLPTFSLSYRFVFLSMVFILTLIINLVYFLRSKVTVFAIDFVSQNLNLVAITTYAILGNIQSIRTWKQAGKIFHKLNKMDLQLKCIGLEVPSFRKSLNRRLLVLCILLGVHQAPDFLIWLTGNMFY
uniref:Uncharacterized protein n=1 Tax=Cacopsylla melanoneura TaxID=428564 RepID=A0A8D9B8G2_9HEMI